MRTDCLTIITVASKLSLVQQTGLLRFTKWNNKDATHILHALSSKYIRLPVDYQLVTDLLQCVDTVQAGSVFRKEIALV